MVEMGGGTAEYARAEIDIIRKGNWVLRSPFQNLTSSGLRMRGREVGTAKRWVGPNGMMSIHRRKDNAARS
jgi:hypothetical protein